MSEAIRSVVDELRFLDRGGELAKLIRAFDWSLTSIGAIAGWPRSLRTTVALVLRSPVPMALLWGTEGIMIYNDKYSVIAGGRHPGALGSKVRESWPEITDFNDHVMRTVLSGGTLTYTDQQLTLNRNGCPEQVWLTLDYSPVVDDNEEAIGVLAVVVETTEKVRAERWLGEERERMRQMFEQAPGFMAMLRGPDHVFDLVNPAYMQLIGHRRVLGMSVAEALPDAVAQGYLDILDRVYRTGEAFAAHGSKYVLHVEQERSGIERYVDFVYQPVRSPSGEVIGIFVEGSDVTDRRLAQRAVEESEAQFRTFAQTLPNHVWTAPPDGQLDWFNDRVYEYSGAKPGELDGQGWIKIVHEDDRTTAGARWAASLASDENYEAEFRLRRADGVYRWHLARAVPLVDTDGRVSRWVGTNTDIHHRKMAEAQTTRDRDRIWTLSQELMLVCDFEGVITAVNPSGQRLLGWSDHEMVGRAIGEFVHPDDVSRTAAEVARLSKGATTLAFESRYRTKDGDYKLLNWAAVPDSGHIHAVARDVTQERATAEERERIWTSTNDLMGTLSPEGLLKSVNPAWQRLLGYAQDEILQRRLADIVVAEDRRPLQTALERLGAGDSMRIENRLTAKDGGHLLLAWSAESVGDIFYLVGRNVTDQRAAEDALRQSQKMEAVGQLTGGIAHDFNNLLQGITGSLDLVQKRIMQGRFGELDRFISGAMTSANRASALTHRLLAFSRRQPLDPRPIRTNPLITSMEDLLRRTIGEKITLELVLSGGLWLTKSDSNQLESAILNLVINARDAMPEGGTLTIETANTHLDQAYGARQLGIEPGQYVCVSVTDTGTGMSEDTMSKAFEPFFTTKPIGQGTGLGLSMIYGFTRQSEGFAKIYSELGRGTTVKLYLPRHRGELKDDDRSPELTDAHKADADETVLVVEDEPVVRGLIVEVLRDLGYRALQAGDGPAGLEILQSKQRIDLLVTDIGLPGLNGRQIVEAARKIRPGLKVLFMTGYAENAAVASGFLEAGMSMITKPFAMEALATRIRETLEM